MLSIKAVRIEGTRHFLVDMGIDKEVNFEENHRAFMACVLMYAKKVSQIATGAGITLTIQDVLRAVKSDIDIQLDKLSKYENENDIPEE